MSAKILLIEDENDIRQMLKFSLESQGYEVLEAADGESGFRQAYQHKPDLILLDWMLPNVSGIDVLKQIRQQVTLHNIPVIMVTAKGEELDQVMGLDTGADDYVVKPFSPKTLISRIQAILRRTQEQLGVAREVIRVGQLTLDLTSHEVKYADSSIHLGPTEFRFLHFLITHPNRVYSRAQLLQNIWGDYIVIEPRTVDVHIRRLRKALEPFGIEETIQTVRSSGYKFVPQE